MFFYFIENKIIKNSNLDNNAAINSLLIKWLNYLVYSPVSYVFLFEICLSIYYNKLTYYLYVLILHLQSCKYFL